mmetsp:Transcript_88842/g.141465  ORF Transcript_88842/g.141465 Transcript_88842/m.141465 type:complete len:414 (+) Transcript_88842:63-1304(+)
MAALAVAVDELRLNVSLSSATSQFPGRWEELRDAALSVLLVLFHFSLLRLWRWRSLGSLGSAGHQGQHATHATPASDHGPPKGETVPREEIFGQQVLAALHRADVVGTVQIFHGSQEELVHFSQAPALLLRSLRLAVDDATGLWDLYEATKDHLEYSRSMFLLVISSLCKLNDVDSAMEVLRDMILQAVAPDASCYAPLIRAQLGRGDLESGLQLLAQMQRQQITPDVATLQAVLEVAAQRELPVLVEELVQSMENWKVVSSSTMATMVRFYGRRGDVGKAFQIFREMPRKFDFKVDSSAYISMLCICAAEGEISDAFQIYEEMLAAGYETDTSSFKALLSASLQHGDLDTACHVLRDALARQTPAVPQASLELFLLQAQRRGRKLLAEAVLEDALKAGLFVSERMVNSLRRA